LNSGRTGRIGNQGVATSFYNDRDEDLGPVLTKVLLETGQEIPDFLQQYVPEDTEAALNFDDDSGSEDTGDEGDADEAGGWGASAEASGSGAAWGATAPAEPSTPAAAAVAPAPPAWSGGDGGDAGGTSW
jgi:ATP-dependent RNA helicase DDX3X